ncbi:PREDICTED: peroxiredoxin-2E-2, chloroplastic-like [Nicotiana attenuata]|uniref:Glutaredoxin-dependent peroxiredoxin n=1 Tax=Nicotiana attenuata TaxID=49451 RepID=A0A1J6IVW2_NICAT|nr:PREDICTED: peroxiredoxin-2E-2, chloroplastic-like [Nicotiana attenuata]OIT08412.1 peroxiredoxin-2e-2, chloroplastic [Nicotiana attenuata]
MAATSAAIFTLPKLHKSSTTPKPLFPLSPKPTLSSFSLVPLKVQLSLRNVQPLKCAATPRISATISVGDTLPNSTLSYFDSSDELKTLSISDLTNGKKVVLLAVPGAFTPTCSQKHLPGFVEKSKELKSKGVDTIACISVNDAFVMKSWKENLKINDEVLLLSDGNLEFTKAIGCELDLSDKPIGLGVRSRRYAMLVDDGVVKVLNLEEGGAFNVSSAEDILKTL